MVKRLYGVAIPSGMIMSMPSILVGLLNGILAGLSQLAVAVFRHLFQAADLCLHAIQRADSGDAADYQLQLWRSELQEDATHPSLLDCRDGSDYGGGNHIVFGRRKVDSADVRRDGRNARYGVQAFRIICVGFIFSALGVIIAGAFEALGMGGHSLIISLAAADDALYRR